MIYDILIIGSGIAGVTASIYAKMAGLNVSTVGNEEIGGKIKLYNNIYNFPGFLLSIIFIVNKRSRTR